MILNKDNYFELFGIDQNATDRDIRLAYTKLLRQYPHEKFPEEFILFTEARDTLLDPVRRQKYVQDLNNGGIYDKLLIEMYDLCNQKRFYDAQKIVDKLLAEGYNNDAEVLKNASLIAELLKQKSKQVSYIHILERNHAHQKDIKIHLANYYFTEKNFSRTRKYLMDIIDNDPNDVNAILFMLDTYIEEEQYTPAKHYLESNLDTYTQLHHYAIYGRGFIIAICLEDPYFAKKLVHRLRDIAPTIDHHEVLRFLIDDAITFDSNSNAFKFYIDAVDIVNNGKFDDVNDWLRREKRNIDPNLTYFEMNPYAANSNRSSHQTSHNTTTRTSNDQNGDGDVDVQVVDDEIEMHGSLLWAIIFGILVALFSANPIAGIVVGAVWYFFAGFIKGCLSCLVIIIIVGAILGFFFS